MRTRHVTTEYMLPSQVAVKLGSGRKVHRAHPGAAQTMCGVSAWGRPPRDFRVVASWSDIEQVPAADLCTKCFGA